MKTIRVLIADDHPLFRDGLRMRLNTESDMEVVGEASTGDEAVSLVASLAPDIILIDLNFRPPSIHGIEAIRRIYRTSPYIAILVITMLEDDSVFAAIRAGARGYLLKDADSIETVHAIRAVSSGEVIFSPSIAQRVLLFFRASQPPVPTQTFPDLTTREREILTLIAQGLTNAAIAEKLVLTEKTVRNHVSNIYGKLGVASRAEAKKVYDASNC